MNKVKILNFLFVYLISLEAFAITLTFVNTTKNKIPVGFSKFRINHTKQIFLDSNKVVFIEPLKTQIVTLPDTTNYKYPSENYRVCYHIWSAKMHKGKWRKDSIFAENICKDTTFIMRLYGQELKFEKLDKSLY